MRAVLWTLGWNLDDEAAGLSSVLFYFLLLTIPTLVLLIDYSTETYLHLWHYHLALRSLRHSFTGRVTNGAVLLTR